jgi:hypothetical protein
MFTNFLEVFLMRFMKLLVLAAVLPFCLLSVASGDIVASKDIRGATTWDAFTIQTMPAASATTFLNLANTNTVGYGQSFTATATGNVDAISFGVTRMYAGQQGLVNVYQMYGGDGATPDANPTRFRNGNPDWMSDTIASFNFDTTSVNINSSGDGNNMYTFSLSGADQFGVVSGGTYMISIEGAGTDGANILLLDKVDGGTYAGGTYGVPDGGSTTPSVPGRDAMLAVNISAVPEPNSIALVGWGSLLLFARRRRA